VESVQRAGEGESVVSEFGEWDAVGIVNRSVRRGQYYTIVYIRILGRQHLHSDIISFSCAAKCCFAGLLTADGLAPDVLFLDSTVGFRYPSLTVA